MKFNDLFEEEYLDYKINRKSVIRILNNSFAKLYEYCDKPQGLAVYYNIVMDNKSSINKSINCINFLLSSYGNQIRPDKLDDIILMLGQTEQDLNDIGEELLSSYIVDKELELINLVKRI